MRTAPGACILGSRQVILSHPDAHGWLGELQESVSQLDVDGFIARPMLRRGARPRLHLIVELGEWCHGSTIRLLVPDTKGRGGASSPLPFDPSTLRAPPPPRRSIFFQKNIFCFLFSFFPGIFSFFVGCFCCVFNFEAPFTKPSSGGGMDPTDQAICEHILDHVSAPTAAEFRVKRCCSARYSRGSDCHCRSWRPGANAVALWIFEANTVPRFRPSVPELSPPNGPVYAARLVLL